MIPHSLARGLVVIDVLCYVTLVLISASTAGCLLVWSVDIGLAIHLRMEDRSHNNNEVLSRTTRLG